MSWKALWRRLSAHDQHAALAAFVAGAQSPEAERALFHMFAHQLNMREQTLRSWPRDRLIEFVAKRAELALSEDAFRVLLFDRVQKRHGPLLQAVYRHLNIEPPAEGGPPALSGPILPEAARACVRTLGAQHAPAELRFVLDFLRLHDAAWQPLADALGDEAIDAEAPPVKTDLLHVLRGFTTMDRVVIECIVATSCGAEAALDENEIDDLVHTLIALNPRRKRSYFALGLTDVLIAGRALDFGRPEFDAERRAWYLTGVLAGLARQNQHDRLSALVKEQAENFRIAAGLAAPGLALAKTVLAPLVKAGCIAEAAFLIEKHARDAGREFAATALEQVTDRLRAGAAADAMTLVRPLWEALGKPPENEDDDAAWGQYRLELARRAAQCLQAHGEFEEADRFLQRAESGGDGAHRGRVLADRGLVAARLRSVFELTLPAEPEERRLRLEALERGENLFRAGLELSPGKIVTALLALGLLQYLRWRQGAEADPQLREEAIALLGGAIAQMRLSDAAATYERSGLLGQALFMRAVALLHRMEATDLSAALQAWRAITPDAGRFPADDLRLLLEVAEMVGGDYAREFAESIWAQRRHEALDLLLPTLRLDRSGALRRALHQHALDETTPRADRRRIWFTLIPALLQARELEDARRGLDALEDLAEGGEGVSAVMQFLATPAHYDPAWTETEALWVQVRLARRLGDDEAAGRYLRLLFYRVRDADAELAREILELGRTWRLAPDLLAQFEAALPAASEEPAFADGDARLRAGESVRVVFVGGNETQAQYDERIRASLSRQYPGLTVTFRHTGWTSNWGQQLPGLVKECNAADAVVLMTMMRTMLGQSLRASLRRPWVSCAARGEKGIERSILKAASIALRKRAAAD